MRRLWRASRWRIYSVLLGIFWGTLVWGLWTAAGAGWYAWACGIPFVIAGAVNALRD